jgi:hypothetical protein
MTHISTNLFVERTVTSSLPSADILETLPLLCLVTDTKYFSIRILHLKEFRTPPTLDIAYIFFLVIDVHFYRLQRNCSYKFWSDWLSVGGWPSASRTVICCFCSAHLHDQAGWIKSIFKTKQKFLHQRTEHSTSYFIILTTILYDVNSIVQCLM